MIRRPGREELKVIGLYTGKILHGVGLLMVLPLVTSLVFREWNPAIDFLIGLGACLTFGLTMELLCRTDRDLTLAAALVVVSSAWFMAVVLGAIPLWLSGHFGSFLDACFDLMSGLTTTGLYMIQDLDHVAHGFNMWRHLLCYLAGQGIIVVALTFLFKGTAGAYRLYVGEAKEERLLPNVIRTARAIWLVSLVYLAAGTMALWGTSLFLGQEPVRGFLHALWIFMCGWATAGYAPQSYNTFYYHSLSYEMITLAICVAGTINFALHWAVWTGNRAELRKNIEIASMYVTMTAALLVTAAGLMKLGVYPDTLAVFRKMFYQVVSGHTGTGFATVYSRTFVRQWGPLAMLGVTMAMAVGGSACSTAGGIKGIRMGVIFKAFVQTVRRILNPESARVVEKWHHLTDRVLEDVTVRSAMLIALAYLATYGAGALVTAAYGYELTDSLFESVSAAANVGLSSGVTHPSMPAPVKVTYMLQMWAGRLEFLSLFALAGYVVALVRGR